MATTLLPRASGGKGIDEEDVPAARLDEAIGTTLAATEESAAKDVAMPVRPAAGHKRSATEAAAGETTAEAEALSKDEQAAMQELAAVGDGASDAQLADIARRWIKSARRRSPSRGGD